MAATVKTLLVLVVALAMFQIPLTSSSVAGVIGKMLLSGTQLLNVEGPSMSLIDMKFVLFNIGTTDSSIKERLEALDKKFDNFAQLAEQNFEAIKRGIEAIKLQMSIDFSAAGAGNAEQDIRNHIENFRAILERRKELKARNVTTEADYRALADRLSTVLKEAHPSLRDSLPKLNRALDGSLISAQASSGGVLCDVSKRAEIQLGMATQQDYDLETTLNTGPLLVWKNILRIQETAIYVFNLSCQQLNETDDYCLRQAEGYKADLTSQRNKMVTCLDPLLMVLVEEGEVTVRLQTQNLVLGWVDVGREQLPELQSPDDGLAQYVKLQRQSNSKFYTLSIGGSCIVRGTGSLYCQRVFTAQELRVAVIPKRTDKGFMYRLALEATQVALGPHTACFTQQKAVRLSDASKLGGDGYIWNMTEYTRAYSGTGRYVDESSVICAASDLRLSGFPLLALCLACLNWLLHFR